MDTALPLISIRDMYNQSLPFGSLWRDQAALLVFLRHPGCAVCRSNLLDLYEYTTAFRMLDINLAVITMAEPAAAQAFARLYRLPIPIYSDPERQIYRATGFGEGSLYRVASPQVMLHQAWQFLQGHWVGGGQGQSLTQYGGHALIKARATAPSYIHVADPIYHYPSWQSVLEYSQQRFYASEDIAPTLARQLA